MERDGLPEDPAQQWDVLLCVIAYEEKKIDRRSDGPMETLIYIYNHTGIRHIYTEWMNQMKLTYDKTTDTDTSVKNDEISRLWRQRGNIKFKEGAFKEAHDLYTKSVLFANNQGPLYSLAVANRTAAAFRLKKYEECLTDVKRAFDNNYPPELQHKLYLRRAECYLELDQIRNSVKAFNEASLHNKNIPLTGKSKVEFDKLCEKLGQKYAIVKNDISPHKLDLPELHKGENPDFQNASTSVELTQNEEFGRHVVVKEEVNRGDVLFSEEPFAAIKLRNADMPHPYYCDYCCYGESPVIGCNECTRVAFCDETCYDQCQNLYHRWECPGVRSNIFSVIGLAHLAFRTMLKYAHNGFPRLPESAGTPTTAADLIAAYTQVDKVAIYKKDSPVFYSMFNLQTNWDTLPNTDSIQYGVTSTMLVMYLEENTKFFEYFPERVGYPLPMSEMKLLCAALIFRTIGQLVVNAQSILELNIGHTPLMPMSSAQDTWRGVGSGIYPTISMMNHSCEPNVTILFYKSHIYVKAIRELPKGTEVVNCYGPHYARATTDHRRSVLRTQYGFNCKCPACVDESRKNFVSLFSAYSCPSCKGPVTWEGTRMDCHQCPNEFPLQRAQNAAEAADSMHAIVNCKRCKTDVKMDDILKTFHRGLEYVDAAIRAETPERCCDRLVQAHRLMQQVLYRHHNTLRTVVDDMVRKFSLAGEYTKGIELLKQNIQSFEYQYGSFSVEVTNEIRKMAHIMMSRFMKALNNPEQDDRQPIKDWMRETLMIMKKAIQLVELNFGPWQPMCRLLRECENHLENMIANPRSHEQVDCFNYKLQHLNIV